MLKYKGDLYIHLYIQHFFNDSQRRDAVVTVVPLCVTVHTSVHHMHNVQCSFVQPTDFQMQMSNPILSTIKYHKREHCAAFVCVKPLKSSVGFSVRTISRCGECVRFVHGDQRKSPCAHNIVIKAKRKGKFKTLP